MLCNSFKCRESISYVRKRLRKGISADSRKWLCLLVHSLSLIVVYTLTGKRPSLNFGSDHESTLKSVEVIEIATPWFNPNLPEMSGMS